MASSCACKSGRLGRGRRGREVGVTDWLMCILLEMETHPSPPQYINKCVHTDTQNKKPFKIIHPSNFQYMLPSELRVAEAPLNPVKCGEGSSRIGLWKESHASSTQKGLRSGNKLFWQEANLDFLNLFIYFLGERVGGSLYLFYLISSNFVAFYCNYYIHLVLSHFIIGSIKAKKIYFNSHISQYARIDNPIF